MSAVEPQTMNMLSDPEFTRYVQGQLGHWRIPGCALAVQTRARSRSAAGFGVRRVSKREPMGPLTLLEVGSLSKLFTAMAILLAEHDGRLSIDDRVVDHLDWFAWCAPGVADRVTLRDVLLHRLPPVSFGMHQRLVSCSPRDHLARQALAVPPREAFPADDQTYNTNVFPVLTLVLAKATGSPFEDFCRDRLFAPAGMTRTRADWSLWRTDRDRAGSHVIEGPAPDGLSADLAPASRDARPRAIPNVAADPRMYASVTPGTNGVHSCAADLQRWLGIMLSGGIAEDGRVILPSRVVERALAAEEGIRAPLTWPAGDTLSVSRASIQTLSGFLRGDLGGEPTFYWTGCTCGSSGDVWILPGKGVTLTVLHNAGWYETGLHASLAYAAIDRVAGTALDADDAVEAEQAAFWAARPSPPGAAERPPGLAPGRYRDNGRFGDLTLSHDGHLLRARVERMSGRFAADEVGTIRFAADAPESTGHDRAALEPLGPGGFRFLDSTFERLT